MARRIPWGLLFIASLIAMLVGTIVFANKAPVLWFLDGPDGWSFGERVLLWAWAGWAIAVLLIMNAVLMLRSRRGGRQ